MASQYPHPEHQLASLPREVHMASEQYYGAGGAPSRAWPEQHYVVGAQSDVSLGAPRCLETSC